MLVRLLGGLDYWRYGAEELCAAARKYGFALAIVPGDSRADPRLDALSSLPQDRLEQDLGDIRGGRRSQYPAPSRLDRRSSARRCGAIGCSRLTCRRRDCFRAACRSGAGRCAARRSHLLSRLSSRRRHGTDRSLRRCARAKRRARARRLCHEPQGRCSRALARGFLGARAARCDPEFDRLRGKDRCRSKPARSGGCADLPIDPRRQQPCRLGK